MWMVLLQGQGLKTPIFSKCKLIFIIDLILFIGAFGVFKKLGLLAGFMYSCVVAYLPFAILMFVSAINTRKIKKTYLTFLNTFSGFYNLEGNIINAIAQTAGVHARAFKINTKATYRNIQKIHEKH